MAAPGIPPRFLVQQGNGQVYLSWGLTAGATSFQVNRSTDGVTYAVVGTPSVNHYLDTTVAVGTQYYFTVQALSGSDASPATVPQIVVPTQSGQASLGQLRLMSQQRADRVNSQFVTTSEWNSYINQSYFELYDLLVDAYEDYFIAPALTFSTDGTSDQYALPTGSNYDGAAPFYKLMGVDCGLDTSNNAFVTLKKFNFIARNRYVYPQITNTILGTFNMQYRLLGDSIEFIPTPSTGQIIRLWYIPRMTELLADTDICDGVSGWTEYIIVDAAIKALQKEESDVTALMVQKKALQSRIEAASMNRDAGQPDTISDTRSFSERWGGYGGGPNGDGSGAGW